MGTNQFVQRIVCHQCTKRSTYKMLLD